MAFPFPGHVMKESCVVDMGKLIADIAKQKLHAHPCYLLSQAKTLWEILLKPGDPAHEHLQILPETINLVRL